MRMLVVAWGKVTAETVGNCFANAGISKEKQANAFLDAMFDNSRTWKSDLS